RPVSEVAITSTRGANPLTTTVTDPGSPGRATITADPEQFPVGQDGGPSITTITDETIAADTMALIDRTGVLPELAEDTGAGPIPRIADDGRTPFEAYSRPPPPGAMTGKVPIAIVVTGMGLSEQGTLDAIERL